MKNLRGRFDLFFVLYYLLLSILLKPVDFILDKVLPYQKGKFDEPEYPLIFIIGLPRSGTTLLYQYLCSCMDVTATTNFWALFPKSGNRIKWILQQRIPLEDRSFYGNSRKINGLQEGGSIYNQWFPSKTQHYYEKISQNKEAHLQQYFRQILRTSQKPFISKNGRNIVRLKVLKKLFPEAYYIFIDRDLPWISQSVLIGRKDIYNDYRKNWTVIPKEWPEIKNLDPAKSVALQVKYLSQLLQKEMKEIPENKLIKITYQDFCDSPYRIVNQIVERIPQLQFRKNSQSELEKIKYKASKKLKVPEIQFNTMKIILLDETH